MKEQIRAQLKAGLDRFPDGVKLPFAAPQPNPEPAPTAGTVPDIGMPKHEAATGPGRSFPSGHTAATSPPEPPQRDVLTEAAEVINGDREQEYGDARENFARIAGMWSAYLGIEVTAHDVANLMITLKVARGRRGYHRDSYVDIPGYARLAEQIAS